VLVVVEAVEAGLRLADAVGAVDRGEHVGRRADGDAQIEAQREAQVV
jgi:hypothetical protein